MRKGSWKLSKRQKKSIVDLYITKKKSINEISDIYDVTPEAVWHILKRRGIKCRSYSNAGRKYDIEEDFFKEINSEKKAYWLGFIYADGWIKSNTLSIALAYKDTDHLKKFRDVISPKKPIYQKKVFDKRTGKNYPTCELAITGKKFITYLKKFMISPREDKFPDIPKELNRHFIRGLFDGDGTVGRYSKHSEFAICCKRGVCNKIQEIFATEIGLSKTKLKTKGNSLAIRYNGLEKLEKIYNYLYKGSNIYLERKKEVFSNY